MRIAVWGLSRLRRPGRPHEKFCAAMLRLGGHLCAGAMPQLMTGEISNEEMAAALEQGLRKGGQAPSCLLNQDAGLKGEWPARTFVRLVLYSGWQAIPAAFSSLAPQPCPPTHSRAPPHMLVCSRV